MKSKRTRGWLAVGVSRPDRDEEAVQRWERDNPGAAWRRPADVLAHFGDAVEAHNGALAGGVPDDMAFLFRTQDDAGRFAARDPALAAGIRQVQPVAGLVLESVEVGGALEWACIRVATDHAGAVLYPAHGTAVVVLPEGQAADAALTVLEAVTP